MGLICLVIGLVERSRGRRRPPAYLPQYPPGYPYPPPPPGYPAHPGYPPRPPTSKSASTLITIGSVLLVFGIFGNAARVLSGQGAGSVLAVGQCISESDYAATHFEPPANGGCTDPKDTYELAFKGGASQSCPDGKREHSMYERASNHSTTLCFMINLREGQCYEATRDGEAVSMKPDNCAQSRPVHVKVSQRVDGSADKTRCPSGSRALAYPVPPRVYCLVRAD